MKWLDRALSALVVLAAINVAYLSWFSSYDFRLGPIHFVSHGFFKPMLILHTAFFLCVLLRRAPEVDDAAAPGWWKWALAAIGVFWLVLTIPVNATFDEWNYRGYSTEIGGLAGAAKLLVTKQWDAWYRPVGFLSLWLDRQVFRCVALGLPSAECRAAFGECVAGLCAGAAVAMAGAGRGVGGASLRVRGLHLRTCNVAVGAIRSCRDGLHRSSAVAGDGLSGDGSTCRAGLVAGLVRTGGDEQRKRLCVSFIADPDCVGFTQTREPNSRLRHRLDDLRVIGGALDRRRRPRRL
ncbi:MAG: hypothetical protein WDO18_10605 [Acidobacteriota bacterium]